MIVFVAPNVDLEASVRQDYVEGRIDLEEFEGRIDVLLRGQVPGWMVGGLPAEGRDPGVPERY